MQAKEKELKDISIVIATYNVAKTIADCLESIKAQKTGKIELIIVDAGSTDGTLRIIETYNDVVDIVISERDDGIYDAWNKGIRLSSGQWIMFLGADDELMPEALSTYVSFVEKVRKIDKKIDYISSKVQYVDLQGKPLKIFGEPFLWEKFIRNMNVAHVGSLHNRDLFKEIGLYNYVDYKICGDYELLMRKRNTLKTQFIPVVTAKMRTGGVSFSIRALKEGRRAKINADRNIFLCNIEFFIQWLFLIKNKLKFFIYEMF
ncbi:MAG: glycosyltransferase [Bacteroidales bacterium]|jgi:glycosyltransferase involved in cell wall biosynthesis|nr:glycosyltransferase [Bacteroidales bacterium]